MNKQAILHIQDSPYCFPTSKSSMVIRLRTAAGDADRVELKYESKYVIGKSHLTASMDKLCTDGTFDWYEARLELEDTRLAYLFKIYSGDEAFYFSEDGCTDTYDYTLGYYNFFQYPYINACDIVHPVEWMKTAVFYQIFVDRFNRGISDKEDSYVNMAWGDIPTPKSFAGGDIPGITEKLDYISSLGCNALYLTPVFTSISNHKYDISDYYRVDEQFGTNEDLKKLVEECHKRGMHIVLDAVFNHVSDRLMQFEDVLKKGRESEYFDWFIIHGDAVDETDINYETFAHCSYMPKLNTSNPKVREFLNGIASHYIIDYGIDGWRLDVADEISQDYWREFRQTVKQAGASKNREVVIIGENWHDAYRNLRGDQFDSIMNYAFTKTVLDYLAWDKKDARETAWKLNSLLMRNKDGVNAMMLNLLDSHDTHRIFTELHKDRRLAKQALAMLFFFRGAPCIFYGTELLTEGAHDPDCRRCMDWSKVGPDGEFADIHMLIGALSDLKKNGGTADMSFTVNSKDSVLIMRYLGGTEIYSLYINHTRTDATVDGVAVNAGGFTITGNKGVIIHEQIS